MTEKKSGEILHTVYDSFDRYWDAYRMKNRVNVDWAFDAYRMLVYQRIADGYMDGEPDPLAFLEDELGSIFDDAMALAEDD